MKKIFGKIDTRGAREEKENEKAHSSFIGKKYVIGKHTVVVEVRQDFLPKFVMSRKEYSYDNKQRSMSWSLFVTYFQASDVTKVTGVVKG